jgi:3'-phosphoadenosine 5'-phosphosulfate (PAPS) 3'-phosphatase
LDGTKEFIKKNDEFTVNIALIEQHQPVLGVIHVPVTNETFMALQGEGAFKIQTIKHRDSPNNPVKTIHLRSLRCLDHT